MRCFLPRAETLLFRAARGTGIHGLAGIPAKRPGFCRPLLCLSRGETEAYCRALGQAWATDETNLTDAYARNRLRRHVLPVLKGVNPKAEQALGRLAQAKALHDTLEEYSKAQMDFPALTEYTAQYIGEIFE